MTGRATTLVGSSHLGLHPRRTVLGVGFLIGHLFCLLLASGVPTYVLTNDEQRFVLWVFNGFAGAVLFTLLATTIIAVMYGFWNGGPVLAGAIPVVPVLFGYLLVGQSTVSIDIALAMAGGGAGAAAGTVRRCLDAPSCDGAVSVDDAEPIVVGTAVSTAAVVTGSVYLWRLSQTAGPHLELGFWLTATVLAFSVAGLLFVGLLTVVPNLSSRLRVTIHSR